MRYLSRRRAARCRLLARGSVAVTPCIRVLGVLLGVLIGVLLGGGQAARAQFSEGTAPLHVFNGQAGGDSFGWLADVVGDVNQDGINEVVISAPGFSGGTGRIYLYDPAAGALIRAHTGGLGSSFGLGVDGAGDIDNDGVPDVIGGGPAASSGRGTARVYSGADGTLLQVWNGAAAGDRFGTAVGRAGDVDNDGVDDVIISAPFDDTAGLNFGRVYVYSGATRQVLLTFDGEATNDAFGSAVGGDVDFDGDGHADLMVGAPSAGPGNRGRIYVYSGMTGTLLFAPIDAAVNGGALGQFWIESPGDVDNDGTADIYAADISAAGSTGHAYVFSGVDGSLIHQIVGEAGGDQFGMGRGAGDVNGDGHADLFLAAWLNDSGALNAGKGYVVSGADGSILETFTHTIPAATLGFDVIGIESDVDGDGTLDYLITSEQNTGAGKAYVLPGGIGPQAVPGAEATTLAVLLLAMLVVGYCMTRCRKAAITVPLHESD